MNRIMRGFAVMMAIVLAAGVGIAGAAESAIFTTHTPDGDVYVNPFLARKHPDARYLSLVIGVVNNDARPVQLERSSFSIEYAGHSSPGVSVAELRRHYTKLNTDRRLVASLDVASILGLQGISSIPSDFYPIIRETTVVTTSIVELPRGYDTWDVLYFKRPAGLKPGDTFTVKVVAKGWAKPVRVKVTL